MKNALLSGLAVFAMFMLVSCSSTNDSSVTEPTQKSDNTIQGNGAQVDEFDIFAVGFFDCDNNLEIIFGSFTVKLTSLFKQDGKGTYHASFGANLSGSGTDGDGNEYMVKDNYHSVEVSAGCSGEAHWVDSFKVVQKGTGIVFRVRALIRIEYDFCGETPVFNVVVEDVKSICD